MLLLLSLHNTNCDILKINITIIKTANNIDLTIATFLHLFNIIKKRVRHWNQVIKARFFFWQGKYCPAVGALRLSHPGFDDDDGHSNTAVVLATAAVERGRTI